MGQDDKRRAPRAGRPFMARHRPAGSEAEWAVSPLRNLSGSGARFVSDRIYEAGSTLELQLQLPSSMQPVWLRARVSWVRPAPLGTVELGVEFGPRDPATQRLLDGAVGRFLGPGQPR